MAEKEAIAMTNDQPLLSSASVGDALPSKAPQLNLNDYGADIEALGIDSAQAREFLAVLWDIMGRMADLGMRVDVCGQFFNGFEKDFFRAAKGVGSNEPHQNGDA